MKNYSYFRHFNPFYMEKKHKDQKALTLSQLVTTEAIQARAISGINISQRVREKNPTKYPASTLATLVWAGGSAEDTA